MADQAAPQLSAELMTDLRALTVDGFEHWRTNCTEEQKAAGVVELEKFTSDPAFQGQIMGEMADCFAAVGANDAGLINEAQFTFFYAALMASGASCGNFEDVRQHMVSRSYALANRVDPATDGCSFADFMTLMGASMAINGELKAAAGL